MRTHVRYLLALIILSSLAAPAWAERPEAGQGAIFVNELAQLDFDWTDFDNDVLHVIWDPAGTNDYARQTPNGKRYVHVKDGDVEIFARVGGIDYVGRGSYGASFFANCSEFDPTIPAFRCFIGPGPASMNAAGIVTNTATGATCTLSAHLAAFFAKERACEALFGAGSCSIGGDLVVPNERQFDISVTCAE
ncbi:MAG TPA: hypothetical protein VJS92_18240 [Candidatus Polarisedimenticolaceae bacterium]|nr:hypothetical protein [Candidatus Polarisedimenticolaceae bacterium]